MAKRNPATGKFEKRADGKIIKPPGWKAPDVEGEMGRQFAEGSWSSSSPTVEKTPLKAARTAGTPSSSPVFDVGASPTAGDASVAKKLSMDASTTTFDKTMRPKVGCGVICVSPDHPGCVLLGKRIAADGNGTWALPGGHVEHAEQFEECAAREALEETGLVLNNLRHCGTTNTIRREHDYHYVVGFVVGEVAAGATPTNTEPDKCEGWEWVPWESSAPQWSEPVFYALDELRAQGFSPFDKAAATTQTDAEVAAADGLSFGVAGALMAAGFALGVGALAATV
jgi:8-oxo-dGTP diphosphatase